MKIFEFTLTKNGHFGFICLRKGNGIGRLLYVQCIYQIISLSRLGEAWADPTFHNTKCLMLREKGNLYEK